MPNSTVAHAVVKSRLLTTSAPSRETGANNPPCLSMGARHANSANEPQMNIAEDREDEQPAARIIGKCVHGIQHAGTHQEGADQAEGENLRSQEAASNS